MKETLCFCSVVATVAIMVLGCAAHTHEQANNCRFSDKEIPTGYTRNQCRCVPNPIHTAASDDPEWDRHMGRTPKGQVTTSSTEMGGPNGMSGTTEMQVTNNPDHYVECSKS